MASVLVAAVAFAVAGAAINEGVAHIPGLNRTSDAARHNREMEKMAAEREGFSEDRINRMDLHRER